MKDKLRKLSGSVGPGTPFNPQMRAEVRAFLEQREKVHKAVAKKAEPVDKDADHLYVIRNPLTGLIKIGRSNNPVKRIRALSTACGARLEVIAIVKHGGPTERGLHRRFKASRTVGEWFHPTAAIQKYIEGLTRK